MCRSPVSLGFFLVLANRRLEWERRSRERRTRRGAEQVGDKEEERIPRSPLKESPWARVPLIIIRSNSSLGREKEEKRQRDEKGKGGSGRSGEYRVCGSTGSELTGV